MAIKFGAKKVKDVYLGESKVDKIYIGDDLVYESTKWQKIWEGISLFHEGTFDETHYVGRNDFGLKAGAPTQVSAELHKCEFGCVAIFVHNKVDECIVANPTGDESNLPWVSKTINLCTYYPTILYLDGALLRESCDAIHLPNDPYIGTIVVTQIWQKI